MKDAEAVAAELGIDPVRIRNWIASGDLAVDAGKVDKSAVLALVRVDSLTSRVSEAEATVLKIRQGLDQLPDSFRKTSGRQEFWLPFLATCAAVGVAIWGVTIAVEQLEAASASVKAQTTALQTQTAYAFQGDILDLFERISAPDLTNTEVDALLVVYDERLRIGDMLASDAVGAIEPEFWKSTVDGICVSWKEALCPESRSLYLASLRKSRPGIAAICFANMEDTDNICPIE